MKKRSKWEPMKQQTWQGEYQSSFQTSWSLARKKTKRKSHKEFVHTYSHTHCRNEKPPNGGKLRGHSVPIKWKPASHSVVTPHTPPWKAASYVRHPVSQPCSNTGLLPLIHSKVCEQERKISKYPQEIWPQLEDSTLALLTVYLWFWQMNKPIPITECINKGIHNLKKKSQSNLFIFNYLVNNFYFR